MSAWHWLYIPATLVAAHYAVKAFGRWFFGPGSGG